MLMLLLPNAPGAIACERLVQEDLEHAVMRAEPALHCCGQARDAQLQDERQGRVIVHGPRFPWRQVGQATDFAV